MNEQLLEFLLLYGVLALAPVLIAAAIGLPLPASLLLLAAGAFSGGGQLDLLPLLVCGIVSTAAGNAIGYWIGRRGGEETIARWGARLRIDEATVARAERFFARWGSLAVLLSRFPISPLSPVVNLVAGTGHYPFRVFAFYNLLGVAIWVGFYMGLGYAFSASWDVLADTLGNATLALTLLVVIVALVVLLVRALKHRHDDHPADSDATHGPELHGGGQHAD